MTDSSDEALKWIKTMISSYWNGEGYAALIIIWNESNTIHCLFQKLKNLLFAILILSLKIWVASIFSSKQLTIDIPHSNKNHDTCFESVLAYTYNYMNSKYESKKKECLSSQLNVWSLQTVWFQCFTSRRSSWTHLR